MLASGASAILAMLCWSRRPRAISTRMIVVGSRISVLKAIMVVIGPSDASPKVRTIRGRPSSTVLEKPALIPINARSSPDRSKTSREKTISSIMEISPPPK